MKWIDAQDLDRWADQPECQNKLPWLIHRLIRSTVARLEQIDIPWGSSVEVSEGGMERVETPTGNEFVPQDTSAWEMSGGVASREKRARTLKKERESRVTSILNMQRSSLLPRECGATERGLDRRAVKGGALAGRAC